MNQANDQPTLKSQPWWEVGEGWRVHLGLDRFFCQCWNRYTGEQTDWPTLIPALYPETKEGDWLRLVTDAKAHGRKTEPAASLSTPGAITSASRGHT
jgi:hypothetical protein